MLSTAENNQIIRNYAIALVSVIMMSFTFADLYNQPSRMAQQNRLDNYSRFLSAGMVTKFQSPASH
jgi:hypothetical protein